MRKQDQLISALAPVRPCSIWDAKTGEALSFTELNEDLHNLLNFVQEETTKVFETDTENVIKDALSLKGSANSYGRQKGYKSSYLSLPREILAKSRINELFLHKLMTEVASYAKNDNPKKNLPRFAKTINLGAVDKNMVSLSSSDNRLTLLWKCWSREYLLEFNIPSYILSRKIIKYSLPVVRYGNTGYDFIFTAFEQIPKIVKSDLRAGLDLGRVEPYTLAVVNNKEGRIAHYTTSRRLKQLNRKRENVLSHKRAVVTKIDQYKKLGMDISILETEKTRLSKKAEILGKVVAQNIGSEIAKKLRKHNLNLLNVENLSWVQGSLYGSKWNHSNQQKAINHALLRNGTKLKKISPKNSSQICHICKTKLTHSSRKVRCSECQLSFDRDYNAAMNLATESHLKKCYPSLMNRPTGDNSSPNGQVIDLDHSSTTKLLT